jgi:prolyl-tRNA synthetase
VYRDFAEQYMAMPVLYGEKSEGQRFPGAVRTYCIEAMMQDKRALQAGTSHNLGQNFAKAFDVTFQNVNNQLEHVWATSWGVSTRLVGALIMTHGDDDGVVIPPRLAQVPVCAVPIFRKDDEKARVLQTMNALCSVIRGRGVNVKMDDRDNVTPGFKFAESELFGYPLRIELGPRDLEKQQAVITKRNTREKIILPLDQIADQVPVLLENIQQELFDVARKRMDENTHEINSYDELKEFLAADRGFALVHWAGSTADEKRVQEETKATHRVIPLNGGKEPGKCILTGKDSPQRVVFAKAY